MSGASEKYEVVSEVMWSPRRFGKFDPPEDNVFGLYHQIMTTEPDFGVNADHPPIAVCQALLRKEEAARPTAAEALAMVWLREKWLAARLNISHARMLGRKVREFESRQTTLEDQGSGTITAGAGGLQEGAGERRIRGYIPTRIGRSVSHAKTKILTRKLENRKNSSQ